MCVFYIAEPISYLFCLCVTVTSLMMKPNPAGALMYITESHMSMHSLLCGLKQKRRDFSLVTGYIIEGIGLLCFI